MCVFDSVAIHTTLEFDCLICFFFTLTECEKFLSRKVSTMDDSLLEEFVHDTIECCLIHFATIDKYGPEYTERTCFFSFEICENMTSMNSRKHKKTSELILKFIVCIFLQMQVFYLQHTRGNVVGRAPLHRYEPGVVASLGAFG